MVSINSVSKCINFVVLQATEEDLTDEYRAERDKLLVELKNGIKPKEKNGSCYIIL